MKQITKKELLLGNIHDNSEEVRECFPDSKSEGGTKPIAENYIGGNYKSKQPYFNYGDSGNASRFFKSIIYQAKASKSERNKGCDELDDNFTTEQNKWTENDYRKGKGEKTVSPTKNNHPTVKPLKLMQYLINLITPENGIVLDPFVGSGTTAIAAILENKQFIAIEKEPEYFEIAKARIKHFTKQPTLFD